MGRILLVYGTGEGQTAKVADRLVGGLADRGHDATALDVEALPADLDLGSSDGVVVGSSIHLGRHHEAIRRFGRDHRDRLAALPSACFQVCLSSAVDDPERRAEAAGYLESLAEETGWRPDLVASFAGALRYSRYGRLKRAMMRRIARDATGDTDASRDYEYTDWDAVEAFAADVAALVDGGRATPDPAASTAG